MKLKPSHEQDFETYLSNIGLKDVTLNKHLSYFKQFYDMFDGFITQKTIDSYLQIKTSPNHRATIKHIIELLKRDDQLTQEAQIEVNRFEILKKVGRKEKTLLRILTPEEVKRLITECRLSTDFITERFKLMVKWQYSGAMRINELCGLKWKDLGYISKENFLKEGRDKEKNQKIIIPKELGKGNKESIVYIKTEYYLAYIDFLKSIRELSPKKVHQIINNEKTIWMINKKKYSSQFKSQFYYVLGWNLPQGKSTHILRHSRCSNLLKKTKNLLAVRDFMRHESVKTTEVYVHLDKDIVSEELEKIE